MYNISRIHWINSKKPKYRSGDGNVVNEPTDKSNHIGHFVVTWIHVRDNCLIMEKLTVSENWVRMNAKYCFGLIGNFLLKYPIKVFEIGRWDYVLSDKADEKLWSFQRVREYDYHAKYGDNLAV